MTAEGIERPTQLALLARERDVTLQGYLFSRPIPEAEWLQLLPQVAGRLEQLLLSMPPPRRCAPVPAAHRSRDAAVAALSRPSHG